jgi:hypothetical protein
MLADSSQPRVLGPHLALAAGFADELARRGYRPRETCNRLVMHLSYWLVDVGISSDD